MNKIFLVSAILIGLVIPVGVLAYQSPGKPSGFMNDFAGVLGAQEKQEIETELVALQRETGFQVSVVMISSLDGETVETYAEKLFQEWGIGDREKDTGILLLAAIQDRSVRIETGYGAEGAVTDIQAGNIIRTVIVPSFANGKYSDGISGAVGALRAIIIGSPEADQYSAPANATPYGSRFNFEWALFLIVIIINSLARFLGKTKSWWLGGVLGAIAGTVIGVIFGFVYTGIIAMVVLTIFGLLFDFIVSRRPPGSGHGGIWPMFFGGRHGGGGGFGGFGGGMSGGGGASGRW